MLRALTSYFFGSIQEEVPEVPVECETREVNDWLVVNLPDQTKSCVTLDDETEVDDEVDLIEDDILMSVAVLMQSDELSDESMYMCEDVCDGVINITNENSDGKHRIETSQGQLEDDCGMTGRELLQKILQNTVSLKLTSLLPRYPIEYSSRVCKSLPKPLPTHIGIKQPLVIKNIGVTCICNPKYSKAYVNHRHPNSSQKTDLMQRIKELEPEQKAIQRITKKNYSKGQINRQNKNYIYEKSSKKNRRSNLQRNHSGANNNRKC